MNNRSNIRQCGTQSPAYFFHPGGVSITDTAWSALAIRQLTIDDLLRRHCSAEWDGMTDSDRRRNLDALQRGGRILSSFPLDERVRVWIITEADRSATTIVLPGEY